MGRNGQYEELCRVYAEKSDGELLALSEDREDLTDLAQEALAQALQERGLTAVPVAEPVVAAEGAAGLGDGSVLVYLFTDAFEAREAMRHMGEADIAHQMLNWHEVEPGMTVSYTGLDLGLVVAKEDAGAARLVLKEKLGLFPAAEGTDDAAEGFAMLGMFSRDEALSLAGALGEAGVSFGWRDGRDATEGLPDAETVAIDVRISRLAEAEGVVARLLG
jgi:hypothetical protein